jgi:L-ribulose-5-phosphate 3-epimerase
MRRRDFMKATVAAAPLALLQPAPTPEARICLFTDHLAGLDYQEVATMLRQVGLTGVDLTVRAGGLVRPERVAEDLPRAAAVFKANGLSIPMITTGITSLSDPLARVVLTTAARLAIGYYKLGYYRYENLGAWQATLASTQKELKRLVDLGRRLGIQAGFHNHSGPFVGGALWDSWQILQDLDSKWIGFYFDPGQATIEGGNNAWNLGFRRVRERLKMIAIKDFIWEKSGGEWRTRWVPLGEGMVRWPDFFKILKQISFQGPISLHIEYDPGGSTKAARFENSLAAAARDLQFLKQQLRAAYS